MPELIGELCAPRELIVPLDTVHTAHEKLGSLKMSSAKLYVHNGTTWERVTST